MAKTRSEGEGAARIDAVMARRRFIQTAAAGTVIVAFGGAQFVLSDVLSGVARAETRADGRQRLPPGQRVIARLKPMGGEEGDPSPGAFRLKVHGLVDKPLDLRFNELLALPQASSKVDVHCVTGWTVLGASFTGVRVSELAKRAGVKPAARHVIFEAAHGYTSNVTLHEAMKDNVLVAHQLEQQPLPRAHGSPVRAVVPDLYFWKSAKWLTGIRFVERDEPGYWEQRGYNNHADPWREERYA